MLIEIMGLFHAKVFATIPYTKQAYSDGGKEDFVSCLSQSHSPLNCKK